MSEHSIGKLFFSCNFFDKSSFNFFNFGIFLMDAIVQKHSRFKLFSDISSCFNKILQLFDS
jgi:hypothetical protein